MATRVFCPAESRPVGRSRKSRERERVGELVDLPLDVGHAVEHAEDAQILPHGEAMRQIDIGAFEIHAAEHRVALARRSWPKTRIAPSVGSISPMTMPIVVVLPAPLPPSSPVTRAGRQGEIERPDDAALAIGFGEA